MTACTSARTTVSSRFRRTQCRSASPTWARSGAGILPKRPVNQFAVDRSNWRIAYAAFGGFNVNTPNQPGHVFATSNGGQSWTDITHGLPDVPADTIALDPSDAKTLYVGTDVGAFVTHDRGQTWHAFGTGMPKVAVWQLDYDATNGVLAAGTHGRGAYTMSTGAGRPALVASTTDAGTPVGPGSPVTYQITVRNIGSATAKNVSIVDPIPVQTHGSLSRTTGTSPGPARRSGTG